MRNKLGPATALLESVADRLRAGLPDGTTVVVVPEADAPRLEITAQGRTTHIAVDLQPRVEPRDVLRMRPSSEDQPNRLLVARHLSSRTRGILTAMGRNYVDATGNYRLRLADPAMYISQSLGRPDPSPPRRALQSLKGAAAARIVMVLAETKSPIGIRELAKRAHASAAMASRVVELLDREAVLSRTPRGPIQVLDWRKLLMRWAEDYSYFRTNRVFRFLELRGRAATLDVLAKSRLAYAITGATAADRLRSIASSQVLMVYTSDASAMARELDLEPREQPATVYLAEPFDSIVLERASMYDGLRFVSPAQLVVDLWTSGDRYPQIADSVLSWMSEHEATWRA